jgi:hypothetical protein
MLEDRLKGIPALLEERSTHYRVPGASLGELSGITIPALPSEKSTELEIDKYEGIYDRLAARLIVETKKGKLFLTQINRRPLLPEQEQEVVTELHPVTDRVFFWIAPGSKFKNYVTFMEFGPDGRAQYLHDNGRSAKRAC